MSKRFTETSKWDDPWFIDLSAEAKIFWQYILDKCDNGGVIDISSRQAEFLINGNKKTEDLISELGDRLERLESGKYFVPSFVYFQFGQLKPESNLHKNVILSLRKNGLMDRFFKGSDTLHEGLMKGPSKGIGKGIGKGKDQVKVKDKEKSDFSEVEILEPYPFEMFWEMYDKKTDRKKCEKKYNNLKEKEKKEIFNTLPEYLSSTPDKQFRKNPETYLNQKGWEHEIIKQNGAKTLQDWANS